MSERRAAESYRAPAQETVMPLLAASPAFSAGGRRYTRPVTTYVRRRLLVRALQFLKTARAFRN